MVRAGIRPLECGRSGTDHGTLHDTRRLGLAAPDQWPTLVPVL